ncbi:hypothetical protein JHK87_049823 [Glycine soja]|nr:hypothetical protein JHK87_049823 [Glycine soja]
MNVVTICPTNLRRFFNSTIVECENISFNLDFTLTPSTPTFCDPSLSFSLLPPPFLPLPPPFHLLATVLLPPPPPLHTILQLPAQDHALLASGESIEERKSDDVAHGDSSSSLRSSEPSSVRSKAWPFSGGCDEVIVNFSDGDDGEPKRVKATVCFEDQVGLNWDVVQAIRSVWATIKDLSTIDMAEALLSSKPPSTISPSRAP